VHSSTETAARAGDAVRRASQKEVRTAEALLPPSLINAAFAYLLHRVPTQEVAEDLLMDAVEAALKGMTGFRAGSAFATWLLSICRNKVADWYRKQAGQAPTLVADDSPDAAAVAEERERTRAVVAACDELPDPLRDVFWLRKAQGLPAREVAELTGLAPSTVHAYTSQACAQVRQRLARDYPELREQGATRDD